MVWMVLAIMLCVVLFTVNIVIARFTTEAGFRPTNVGTAYGIVGAWLTAPIATAVLYHTGVPIWLAVAVGITVLIVPYFLGQLPAVKELIDVTSAFIKSRRPRHG